MARSGRSIVAYTWATRRWMLALRGASCKQPREQLLGLVVVALFAAGGGQVDEDVRIGRISSQRFGQQRDRLVSLIERPGLVGDLGQRLGLEPAHPLRMIQLLGFRFASVAVGHGGALRSEERAVRHGNPSFLDPRSSLLL